MDDVELYREQILRHTSPVITGRFAGYQASYTREVTMVQPLLMACSSPRVSPSCSAH